jgi:hypothetical protein
MKLRPTPTIATWFLKLFCSGPEHESVIGDLSKIPINGGLGAGIAIVVLLTAVLLDLPVLCALVVPGIAAGLVFAGVLRVWRNLHPKGHEPITLKSSRM